MKICFLWGGFCLALLILPGACSKSDGTDKQPPMDFEGVKVDTPQLMVEFLNASPELQKQVTDAVTKVRYKQYLEAMMQLDNVLKNPGLNDKQKKVTTQVLDQLKQLVAKAPPSPNR